MISVLAVIALFAVVSSGGQPRRAGRLRNEVAGGPTHTWSNYKTAEGRPGKPLEQGEHVSVTCKVLGYQVPDGDKWWYRLESSPYNNHFYATADAFYNNGQTSGSLRGSLFVDPRLRRCGA